MVVPFFIKRWFAFNLQAKVMLIFILLALGPFAAIGAFSIKSTEQLIFNMVMRQLENVAADKAAILERWLDERKADLMVMAGTSILKSLDPSLIAQYLSLVQKSYLVYKDIIVISANGNIVYSTGGKDSFPEKNYIPAISQDLQLSNITYLPKEKESAFYISAPISDDTGKPIGAVYGAVGTNKILFHILNVSLGKTGECYLVDKEGMFLAHKEPGRILKENISQSDSFRNIFDAKDRNKIYLDYRGIEVLGTSQKIVGTDWFLVVEQDRDEAFQSLDALKSNIYFIVLLFIISAFALTWIISYHIVKPIRALGRSADILADSEFDRVILKTDRQDEIGMLYRAFENMSFRLKERQDHLEQEVGLKEAELKETDIILKQTKLLAERSEKFAAIGRLGAAVAHEIRTPLTSLKLFLESVQAEIEISPEYQEDYRIAMGQIKRIEGTINRFLDFSKPQELNFSKIDISQLFEDVLLVVKPMINKNECTLDVDIEHDLPKVNGDKKLLGEALINLLVNSLEAMPNHGSLTISAARDNFKSDGLILACVRIDIRDTGQGISEDQIASIFDPFFTTKQCGTGLGLPLVLNTIKRHGGDVRVKSRINKGTEFSLFIPLEFIESLFEENGKDITY
ncbi:Histidine kinase [uncultured Desulfobacterium sp.]|uniref:histidine kinase n=1 Tax=uncultured Desulfobacterium sp. TaxID=201089 RepID=A0A445N1P3_9BACT|nr:Histidine kinase [uncultured Desulfobacterium sp.]